MRTHSKTPSPPIAKLLLRAGVLAVIIIAISEIAIVSAFYLHEPLAWPFLLQAFAMLIGALIGLVIGIKRRVV